MNTWQVARQIQYLLRSRQWPGSANSVFHTDSVKITAGVNERAFEDMILPACLIRIGGATVDPEGGEYADLLEVELIFTIAVSHEGDSWDEYPIVGGQRTGQTDSDGRGVLEIEEELFAAIENLDTDLGVLVKHVASSAAELRPVVKQRLVLREYLFRALVTADRYYHPPINLQEA